MGYLTNCRTGSAVSTCESCKKGEPPTPRELRVFKLQELARATNSFSTKNLLGKGSHACVYKAVLNDGQVVAVKRPTSARRTLQDVTSFDNELEILSKLQNGHLVNLIGFCNESSEKLLVVEFMGNGTLYDLLHSSPEPLNWPLRVQMALQAAKAILALHSASPPIIHRDIKSSNVLVDSNWDAKLGDLGLALRGQLEDVVSQSNPPAGTMGYIDPEYETPSQLSSKSDVFSFGILLLEIMSGRNAIDVRFNPSSIVDWAVPLIRQGKSLALCDPALKPPQNSKVVKQLAAIAARSVRLSRDRRPTMAEVVDGLRQIRNKLPISRYGGKPVRNDTRSPVAVIKGEGLEDFSDGASSSKSESLSILDEGSVVGEGNVSPADSVKSSNNSQMPIPRRCWRVINSDADGEAVVASPQKSPAVGLGWSRKSEQPLFDPNSPPRMSSCSMRIDMEGNSSASSVSVSPESSSPARSVRSILADRSSSTSRRSSESPTFGSKRPVWTAGLRTYAAAPVLSNQNTNSRLHANEKALQPCQSSQRNSTLRTLRREPGGSEASLASSSQLPTNEANEDVSGHTGLSSASKPMNENHMTTATASRARGPAEEDSKTGSNGGSSLQPSVAFTRDLSPIWSTTASVRNFYSNPESHFETVDLPIAV